MIANVMGGKAQNNKERRKFHYMQSIATKEETARPIDFLQGIFLDCFGLKTDLRCKSKPMSVMRTKLRNFRVFQQYQPKAGTGRLLILEVPSNFLSGRLINSNPGVIYEII